MQSRLFTILPALAAVAFLGFGIAHADDAKDTKAPEAKKDCADGCKDDKTVKTGDTAKKDDAKKDEEGCEEGCCGKDAAKVSSKQLECADCEKAGAACDKCKTAVKTGAVAVVPVKGMTCANCANGVAKKLDGIEQVSKFMVSSDKAIAVLVIVPGKTLKLADLSKTLAGTKFSVDEEAALSGRVTFSVAESASCPMCDDASKETAKADKKGDCCEEMKTALAGIKGVESVSIATIGTDKGYTLQLAEGSTVTLKQIREKVTSLKKSVGDFVFTGAPVEESKKSAS